MKQLAVKWMYECLYEHASIIVKARPRSSTVFLLFYKMHCLLNFRMGDVPSNLLVHVVPTRLPPSSLQPEPHGLRLPSEVESRDWRVDVGRHPSWAESDPEAESMCRVRRRDRQTSDIEATKYKEINTAGHSPLDEIDQHIVPDGGWSQTDTRCRDADLGPYMSCKAAWPIVYVSLQRNAPQTAQEPPRAGQVVKEFETQEYLGIFKTSWSSIWTHACPSFGLFRYCYQSVGNMSRSLVRFLSKIYIRVSELPWSGSKQNWRSLSKTFASRLNTGVYSLVAPSFLDNLAILMN